MQPPGHGTEPIDDALDWMTIVPQRTVLLVAHNITTLNRLLDVVSLFESDLRVELRVTSSLSDPFSAGLVDEITALGIRFVPWREATAGIFDLILAASHHGHLSDLTGKIVIISHGIGYPKYTHLQPGTQPGQPAAFGLSRRWLLQDGRPFARALIFSHEEQFVRLAAEVPEAVPTAALVGDPCFDRMLASVARRDQYRRVLGVLPGETLVAVSSTWSSRSLLGSWPDLVPRLLAELPVDSFRLAAIVHPNVAQWHGRFQLRTWFADALRAGLTLIPPLHGWQATLIAADCVIGDHGSVTAYGAALAKPTLLASFDDAAVVPGTAVHRLGELASRLDRRAGLRGQVEDAIAAHDPRRYEPVADLITSMPGAAAQLLRKVCYDVLELAEPDREAVLHAFADDGLHPPVAPRVAAMLVGCETDRGRRSVRVQRFPAETWPHLTEIPTAMRTHTIAHHRHPDRRVLANAEIIFGLHSDGGWHPEAWLRAHPTCVLAATLYPRKVWTVRPDLGGRWLSVEPDDGLIDPGVLASVALTCHAAGIALHGVELRINHRSVRVVAD